MGQIANSQKKLILPLIISFIIFAAIVIVHMGSPFPGIFGNYEKNADLELITILICPIAPIIYGLATKDQVGSIIVGVIPIVAVLFCANFIIGNTSHISRILSVIGYAGSLAIIGGVEGYFASKKRIEHLLIAICSGIVWTLAFFNGIN